MPSDEARDATLREVTPRAGKGALGTWRALAGPGLRAGIPATIKDGPSPACKPWSRGVYVSQRLRLPWLWKGSRRTCQGQNHTREIRPCGIVGGGLRKRGLW